MHILRVMAATLRLGGYREQVWEQHEAILNAIEAHDVEKAGTLAAVHTKSASAKLIAAIGDLGVSDDILIPEIDGATGTESPQQISAASKLGKDMVFP